MFVVHFVILKSVLYLRKAASVRTRVFAYARWIIRSREGGGCYIV